MESVLPLLQIPADGVTRLILLVGALIVLWIILRFVLRLATRIFATGCLLLLILGLILIVLRSLG